LTDNHTYIFEWDKVDTRLQTPDQVCDFLDQVAAVQSADVSVMIDHGRQPNWFDWLLGARGSLTSPCFNLQKEGEVARLIFGDEAWSEYRAMDPEHPVEAEEDVRRKLSMGELGPAPPEECLDAGRAFGAARHYLLHGERPHWLSYRYVP
jgi:hypothetical protein